MDTGNTPADRPIFSATITPHRSLGRTGFIVLMSAIGLASFIAGIIFIRMGAWPIFGFLGLDVLLIYWAFRANYRSARACEEIVVGYEEIRVRRADHRGNRQEWKINPLWAKIEREEDEEFGLMRLYLVARGRRLSIAHDLSPNEKSSFAAAFGAALTEAKRGPTRTVFS
jgi:uncharacterized membrane protein